MTTRIVRTTVALPADLLEAADNAIRDGKARSRNELVAAALRRELAAEERTAVDAAFAAMADDSEYQAEALAIEAEFASAGEEAMRLAEADR
jgi:metal-responsive CopG/Arc/MetJ family transcriptional regulator